MSDIPGYLTTKEAAERSGLAQQTIAHYLKGMKRNGTFYPPRLRGISLNPRMWLVEEKSLLELMGSDRRRGARAKNAGE